MKRSKAYWFESIDDMKAFEMDSDDEDGIFFFVARNDKQHWLYVWRKDNNLIDNRYTKIKATGYGFWILSNPITISKWDNIISHADIRNEAYNQNLVYKISQP